MDMFTSQIMQIIIRLIRVTSSWLTGLIINEHAGPVKQDKRTKTNIFGKKICREDSYVNHRQAECGLPSMHPSSLLTWRLGAGRPFSAVVRIEIHGKIWLQSYMSSRHTLGRFFNLTLTAPEPHSGCLRMTASFQLEFGAGVSNGEFWQCLYCCCGKDMKTALGQLIQTGSCLYQICDI